MQCSSAGYLDRRGAVLVVRGRDVAHRGAGLPARPAPRQRHAAAARSAAQTACQAAPAPCTPSCSPSTPSFFARRSVTSVWSHEVKFFCHVAQGRRWWSCCRTTGSGLASASCIAISGMHEVLRGCQMLAHTAGSMLTLVVCLSMLLAKEQAIADVRTCYLRFAAAQWATSTMLPGAPTASSGRPTHQPTTRFTVLGRQRSAHPREAATPHARISCNHFSACSLHVSHCSPRLKPAVAATGTAWRLMRALAWLWILPRWRS